MPSPPNEDRRPRINTGGLARQLLSWLGRGRHLEQTAPTARRGPVTHVVILDGTMSSLEPGRETNAGLTWKLLRELSPAADLSVRYEPGIQFTSWRQVRDVAEGRGLNRQIRRSYGWLASRYRPGDRIFLFGYSRGAYAVRSLAGVIDRIGLLRPEAATERNVHMAYRHYRTIPDSHGAREFARLFCHAAVEVQMIGAWDTVKALGLRLPVVWRWSSMAHRFHNHALGPTTRSGFHALALNETREAYRPVMWRLDGAWDGDCEQVWFPGTHGDVGGQLDGVRAARPLANISLVWMLQKAEAQGLRLPEGWRARFGTDPQAPSIGLNRGWGRIFVARTPRVVGADRSERLHPSVLARGALGPDAEGLPVAEDAAVRRPAAP
ncbi:Uncharacterized alpha/beta hydrolase domain [Palleronia salina]|uniref:Uncharacterized alpha/beta hydrolase domain n=1 Tax=Palleronia salina TaxID=313368 RepID=A0A1M6BHC7_9RHOB|nr:DUF2235 domain-containing protein [Palleronia salina]SHI48105.1 Uncharacterized alpha/beta hydrolase domain [Palleronia salina]